MRRKQLAAFGTLVAAAATAWALCGPTQAQESIKIGWAISKTGPFAAGRGRHNAAELSSLGERRERRRRHQSRRQED